MPGFFISNLKNDYSLINVFPERCIEGTLVNNPFTVKRNTLNKFLDDKIFYEDEELVVITEGVILNKQALVAKYNQTDFLATIIHISRIDENTFYNKFRGSFSGAIFYKKKNKWIIYTNHYGDKALFYYNKMGKFFIGSQANYILDALKKENLEITINKKAIYFMLTYAFMADDSTYANEIKRLAAGSYIQIENNEPSIKKYWSLEKNKYDLTGLSDDEIIDDLDQKFREAVKMEYDKDIEYNYRHIADLSGGFDSRMNTWVARDLGYSDMVNITYSQSGYRDNTITKEIADYLHNELIFKQLDDASFIYDVDKIINMQYGTAYYGGITGGKRLLDCLNFSVFGIEHTGQLGDVILGSYIMNIHDLKKRFIDGVYSKYLIAKTDKRHLDVYDDHELYKMYIRGFMGILSTHFLRQNYTEVSSPFLDIDFLEYCFSIPVEKRMEHSFYNKWILKKYPKAALFKWENTNSRITTSQIIIKLKVFFMRLKGYVLRKYLPASASNVSMNPFDFWYNTKKDIKDYINNYYENNKTLDVLDNETKKDIHELFYNGTIVEKLQVLTALSAVNFYFNR